MKTAGLLGALFLIGVILLIAGVEGRAGALLAAVLVPDELTVTSNASQSGG